MTSLKCVLDIAKQNFRKWKTDYRIWIIFILLLMFTARFGEEMRILSAYLDNKTPLWVYPFLYNTEVSRLLFILPLALMFCNAPFTDRNNTFVLIRSGRTKWFCGQMLYIVFASGIYFLFLFVVSLLNMLFTCEMSMDWGIVLRTATPSICSKAGTAYYFWGAMSNTVITFFTPLNACWFTFLMSWLMGIMLGLMMFFLNLTTQTRSVGFITAVVLIVFSCIANKGTMLYFSPVSWCTMNNIDVGRFTNKPSFTYCLSAYLILIALFIAGILIVGRKKSLDTRGE